jgi:hypothetical protein
MNLAQSGWSDAAAVGRVALARMEHASPFCVGGPEKAPNAWQVVLAAQRAFGVLASANIYVTSAGAERAMAPHSDRQDVLIVQLEGCNSRGRVCH